MKQPDVAGHRALGCAFPEAAGSDPAERERKS